jgi:hypothetical protein
MKTIKQFVRENNIKIANELVDSNPNIDDPNWQANHYKVVLKRGKKQFTTYFSKGIGLKGEPTVEEVLDCLASDSASIENYDFEDWAPEFGYNKDSRHAEKIYNACIKQAQKLKNFLGAEKYEELLWEVERL